MSHADNTVGITTVSNQKPHGDTHREKCHFLKKATNLIIHSGNHVANRGGKPKQPEFPRHCLSVMGSSGI